MTKAEQQQKKTTSNRSTAPSRLWVRAAFLGFRRSKHTQNSNQVLAKLQNVNDRSQVPFYEGKRVVYVYKAQNKKSGSNFRTIWGRITRAHGNNGVVIARFNTNLPPRGIGSTLRVMLYPNRG